MSLTQDDLKKIKDISKEGTKEVLFDFWDQVLEKKFDDIDRQFDDIDKKLSQKIMKESQATRDHTSKVVADSSGESVKRDRTLNKKTDTTADKLGAKDIFSPDEVTEIKNLSPFPVQPAVE